VGYEIFNLGGGRNPITLLAVIRAIEEYFGRKAKFLHRPFHIADIMETWADISKAERMLGWKPKIHPMDGLKRTFEWYQANRAWLSSVQL